MTKISMTPDDILGAIALQAQRIVAATTNYAAGSNFPDPDAIAFTLTRMAELNNALVAIKVQNATEEAA